MLLVHARLTTHLLILYYFAQILGDSHGNDGSRGLEDGERQRS